MNPIQSLRKLISPKEKNIVALSGGKDSTAMAIRLNELYPEIDFEYICTPTGNELPEMEAHWKKLECILDKPLKRITNGTLESWIRNLNGLPNWRRRWCTANLKIRPALWYLKQFNKPNIYVGLRADEPLRKGIYSHEVNMICPLREWGWGIMEVKQYLRDKGISIPRRTDCALCFYQRVGEWFLLWRDNKELWEKGKELEKLTGYTFRSPKGDAWGGSLENMEKLFEAGKRPRGEWDSFNTLEFFGEPEDEEDFEFASCRVCRL